MDSIQCDLSCRPLLCPFLASINASQSMLTSAMTLKTIKVNTFLKRGRARMDSPSL